MYLCGRELRGYRLLLPEGARGMDPCCAQGRSETGRKRRQAQNRRDGEEGCWIKGSDAKEQRAEKAREDCRGEKPDPAGADRCRCGRWRPRSRGGATWDPRRSARQSTRCTTSSASWGRRSEVRSRLRPGAPSPGRSRPRLPAPSPSWASESPAPRSPRRREAPCQRDDGGRIPRSRRTPVYRRSHRPR